MSDTPKDPGAANPPIGIVFPIIAAMEAHNGVEYPYPMSIKFLS